MNTECVVTVVNQGTRFYLRGTTWAFHLDQANVFPDTDTARAAARKAEKFMATKIRKSYELWSLDAAQLSASNA